MASKENSTLAVFAITERGDKTYWNRVGTAYVNRNRLITVQLEAFPVSGKLQIRSEEKSAFSGLMRSRFRRDSITIPKAFDRGSGDSIRCSEVIRSPIPMIRSAFRSIRSLSVRQPKGRLGMVAAYEATIHAKDSRSTASA